MIPPATHRTYLRVVPAGGATAAKAAAAGGARTVLTAALPLGRTHVPKSISWLAKMLAERNIDSFKKAEHSCSMEKDCLAGDKDCAAAVVVASLIVLYCIVLWSLVLYCIGLLYCIVVLQFD